MQIVFKIDKETLQDLYDSRYVSPHIKEALRNGTQLPEGHGDLVDRDVLDRDLENAKVNLKDALSEAFDDGLTWASEVASKLSPIIKADTEDREQEEDKDEIDDR